MAIDRTTASSPMSSDEGSHRHGPIGVILDVAVRFRWAIIVLTVFAAIYGAFNLVRLPIDAVKIDQAFVRDLVVDEDDRVIASTIIAMAHALGCKVIAEGVETEEQLAFLKEHGCDGYQGFLFSRAVPGQSFEAILRGEGSSAPVQGR